MPKATRKGAGQDPAAAAGDAEVTITLPQLNSMSADDRLMALLAIPQSRCTADPDLMRRVSQALSDPVPDVRVAAAAALRALLANGDPHAVAEALSGDAVDVTTQVSAIVNKLVPLHMDDANMPEPSDTDLLLQLLHLTETTSSLSPSAVSRLASECGGSLQSLFLSAGGCGSLWRLRVCEAAGAALVAVSEDNAAMAALVNGAAGGYESLLTVRSVEGAAAGPAAHIASQAAAVAWNAGCDAKVIWPLLRDGVARPAPGANSVAEFAPADPTAPVVVRDADGDAAMGASGGEAAASSSKPKKEASALELDADPRWIAWVGQCEAQLLTLQTLTNITAAVVSAAAASAAHEDDDDDGDNGGDIPAGGSDAEPPVPIEAIEELVPFALAIVLAPTSADDAEFSARVRAGELGASGSPLHASLSLPHTLRSAAVALVSNAMPLVNPTCEPWTTGQVWQWSVLSLCRSVASRDSSANTDGTNATPHPAPRAANPGDESDVARGVANLIVCMLKRSAEESEQVARSVCPGVPTELHQSLCRMCSASWPLESRATAASAIGMVGRHLDALGLPWEESDMMRDATALAVAMRSEDPFLSCTAADAVMDAFAEPRPNPVIARVNLLPSLRSYAARARGYARDIERLGSDADEEDGELMASLLDVALNIDRFQEYKAEQQLN